VECGDGELCVEGVCTLVCLEPLELCGDACTNTDWDPSNCGECANECDEDEACVEGECFTTIRGTLYFSQDSNADGLYALDTITGRATHIGASGATSTTVGLAYDPVEDILYGSKWSVLMHIERDGSSFTDIGGAGVEGLAYDSDRDILYGVINGQFLTLNPETGAREDILAAPGFDAEGVAVDPTTGNVYVVGRGNTNLHRYDPATTAWTVVGDTGMRWDHGGLAWDPGAGVLYACGSIAGNDLYRIDPATGTATLIGDSGIALRGGLAYAHGVAP